MTLLEKTKTKLSVKYFHEKAEKYYRRKFLVQYIQSLPYDKTEFEIAFGKIPTGYKELSELKTYIDEIKNSEHAKTSYKLVEETIQTRDSGAQTIPKNIFFESEDNLLHFLRKTKEANIAKENYQNILLDFPELKEWILENSNLLIEIEEESNWKDIIKVCRYFLDLHIPEKFYIRELKIEVHSKFIEENETYLKKILNATLPIEKINKSSNSFAARFHCLVPEEMIRMKFLDPSLKEKYNIPFSDFSILLSEFNQLNFQNCNILILENKTSFHLLQGDFYFPNTIALFGSGFGVLNYKETDVDNTLKPMDWIQNNRVYYWGDMDTVGLEILSKFRITYPHTVSIFMDKQKFASFEKFAHKIEPKKEEHPKLLTDHELALYNYLKENSLRLEQERLTHQFIKLGLTKVLI